MLWYCDMHSTILLHNDIWFSIQLKTKTYSLTHHPFPIFIHTESKCHYNPNFYEDQSLQDMVRYKFMSLPLILVESTLQTQKHEMDKQISPYKLWLTSPIRVEQFNYERQPRYLTLESPNFCAEFLASPYKAPRTWSIILNVQV